MVRVILLLSLLLLQACQMTHRQYTTAAAGKKINELGWIVTPKHTFVTKIDGEPLDHKFVMITSDQVRTWVAVEPGVHSLTMFYNNGNGVTSAGQSDIQVTTYAGKTNYIYGGRRGGIVYTQLLLDRPADEALIEHVKERILALKLPCATLPCDN